ncbi:unnamed protein product [Prorocentrum cordatum]|uniref:RanBP2-type domain-containing protein n=1 Tax=Prorocentrum cordatum TaxID=2364126 RepID=A0ABN9XAF5_9DINO|nr:unnamed protein product [Polarella glacialis]
MAPKSKHQQTHGPWRCGHCTSKNGDGYDYCWKCWKAKPAAGTADDTSKSTDEADKDKNPTAEQLATLRVDAMQAQIDTGVPRCFTECRVVRDRNRVEEQRDKCKLRITKLEEDLAKAQKALDDELAVLQRHEDKLQKLNTKIEELSVPSLGTGWGAAVAFLEQAAKCLKHTGGGGGSQGHSDVKLKEALEHARSQKKLEDENAAQAEQARKAAEEAGPADTVVKEDMLEFPAGSDEQAVRKIMQDGGVTPEQMDVHEFITINANSLGTLERVMMQVGYLVQTPAIMAQELQADEHRINLFVGRMEKLGWRLGIVPSVKKEGGWSGGVLVATRRRQGMDFARRGINSWDISPPASRGRLAVAWLDGVCKGGLLFGSAYLWTSEGLTRRNELILTKWASVVNATGYQWVLGGDFNMDPHVIRDSGLLCRMNGIIVHDRQQGSCTMLGQQYDTDCFIVSKSLVLGPLEATVQNGYNASPHSPVVLRLARQHGDDRMVYVLQKPQRHGGHSQDVLDGHWRALGVAYEEHLNRFHSFEGEELTRRQGHYEQAIYKWTCVEAPRLKEASREQAWAEAAEWLSRRLRQLANFVTRWWTSGTDETRRQAIHVADTMLAHEIVMPLMRAAPACRPPPKRQLLGPLETTLPGGAAPQRCPFAVGPQSEKGTAWEDEAASLVSENEDTSLPDLPCEEAEVVQSRLAAGALPRGGEQPGAEEQLTWDTAQWPAIVDTVGSIDVDRMTAQELQYIDCVATLLDVASGYVTTEQQNENISEHALAKPQEAADHSLAGWEAIWGDEYDPTEYRTPPITPKEVLDASDKFRAKTGLGESGWHPRLWKQGGVQGAARVASVLNAVEAGSPWPEPQSTILFYLLAKPAGGYRNLGLIPELARLWETIRFPFARRWEEANRRAYDWAAKGRSSERAAWAQALFCEATVAEGLEYAVTYFDLVKCFEYVTHELVWKVVLRIYAMVRRIVLDGCYARGRRWARGIVAGRRFAPLCLKMVLYMELDGVVEAFPWADTCLFFDDLAMATHGVREFVQYWHSQLVQTLINMFEVVLDMRVSRGEGGKTVTLASTSALNAELGKRIRTHGVRMVKEEKHLGVTTAAGRYRRVGAFSKRAVKFAAKRDRIARVRRSGGPAHKVIRHAKVPSLLYGVNVLGMADTKLGELRQSVATAMAGNAKGRSTYLTLLADDVDPGILANASPILAWAQTWQEAEDDPSLVPRLQAAWKRWVLRVGLAKAPWQQVRGPAGAFVATVKRLG